MATGAAATAVAAGAAAGLGLAHKKKKKIVRQNAQTQAATSGNGSNPPANNTGSAQGGSSSGNTGANGNNGSNSSSNPTPKPDPDEVRRNIERSSREANGLKESLSDYELYQVLEENNYTTTENNLRILKEGLDSGKYEIDVLTEEDKLYDDICDALLEFSDVEMTDEEFNSLTEKEQDAYNNI